MFIKLYARNNGHLLHLIHEELQALGLARTESLISFKEVFKRQLRYISATGLIPSSFLPTSLANIHLSSYLIIYKSRRCVRPIPGSAHRLHK